MPTTDTVDAIAALVRQSETKLGITATVGIGHPGRDQPGNRSGEGCEFHRPERPPPRPRRQPGPRPRGAGRERRQLLRAKRSHRWRRRRVWRRIRGHPGHRMWRWDHHAGEVSPGATPDRRGMGPYTVALADRRGNPRQPLRRGSMAAWKPRRRSVPRPGL